MCNAHNAGVITSLDVSMWTIEGVRPVLCRTKEMPEEVLNNGSEHGNAVERLDQVTMIGHKKYGQIFLLMSA